MRTSAVKFGWDLVSGIGCLSFKHGRNSKHKSWNGLEHGFETHQKKHKTSFGSTVTAGVLQLVDERYHGHLDNIILRMKIYIFTRYKTNPKSKTFIRKDKRQPRR